MEWITKLEWYIPEIQYSQKNREKGKKKTWGCHNWMYLRVFVSTDQKWEYDLWHSLFLFFKNIPKIGWWIRVQETLPEDQRETRWYCEQPEGLVSCYMMKLSTLGFPGEYSAAMLTLFFLEKIVLQTANNSFLKSSLPITQTSSNS